MSDNPEKIAELQNDKLVEILRSKKLGPPVCRHIESKGHNGQEFVNPEYVIDTFPSVEFLRSIKLLKLQIRTLVSVRTDLGVETSTVPYLEINKSGNNASAAASSSSSSSTATTLSAEAAPFVTNSKPSQAAVGDLKVVDALSSILWMKVVAFFFFIVALCSPFLPFQITTLTAEEAEKLMQEAAPLFSSEKYSAAVALYSQVVDGISLNESDASLKKTLSRALSNRSGCFLNLKKSKEALVDARRCVDVRSSWVRAHLRVAEAAQELEEYDLAISAYESAITAEDCSGGNIPSKKELESKILDVNWTKIKSKERVHSCFLIDLVVVASGVSEADVKKLFSSFDQPFTEFFNISRADFIAFGFEQKTVNKIIATRNLLEREGWKKIAFFENEEKQRHFRLASPVSSSSEKTAKLVTEFCELLHTFVSKNSESSYHASVAYHAYLWIAKWVKTSGSVASFCNSLAESIVANKTANCEIFGTVEVKQALLEMSLVVNFDDAAVSGFCKIIVYLTMMHRVQIQKLYGTVDVRDTFFSLSKIISSTDSACHFCAAIGFIVEVEENRELWATQEMVDAMIRAGKHIDVRSDCGVDAQIFFLAIHNLTCNQTATSKLFAVNKIRDVMLGLHEAVRDVSCRYYFCRNLITLSTVNPTLFCVKKTGKAIDFISGVFFRSINALQGIVVSHCGCLDVKYGVYLLFSSSDQNIV